LGQKRAVTDKVQDHISYISERQL